MHITDMCHTCVMTLMLPSKFTLEKMKETCMIQGNAISTGSIFTLLGFLTVHFNLSI